MTDWRDHAACMNTDPGVFHPDKGESSTPAKRICAQCPVVTDCLEHALWAKEPLGVWGGLTARERSRVRGLMGATPGRGRSRECGTVAAHSRHVRRGETPCAPCRRARSDYVRSLRQGRAA